MRIASHHHLWDLSARDYDWMAGEEMAPIRRNFAKGGKPEESLARLRLLNGLYPDGQAKNGEWLKILD